jgi:hypothetical protein
MNHLRYGWYVVRHRWFVMLECFKERLIWQGLVHDWHKFLPSEWKGYVMKFGGSIDAGRDKSGGYLPEQSGIAEFRYAWFLHQHRAKHHWQWFVMVSSDGKGLKVFPMPDKYRREMVADWKGAGRAQGKPDTIKWYLDNCRRMILHPETRKWVEEKIGSIHIEPDPNSSIQYM